MSQNSINLLDLSKGEVENWLKRIDAILTDCDGVLWHHNTAIDGAVNAINTLKRNGKRIYFVTNNGTKTQHQLWLQAIEMGFQIDEADILSPTYAILKYLRKRQFQGTAYIIGSEAIKNELEAENIKCFGIGPDVLRSKVSEYIDNEMVTPLPENVNAVIVGFDEYFTYCKMMKACHYLTANPECLFLLANSDTVHRYPNYSIPDAGAIVKSIETCIGREALHLGKPSTWVCQDLIQEGVLVQQRTLMIGDCYKIDVTFGKNCGFQTMIVCSGHTTLEHILRLASVEGNKKFIPDVYLPKLGDLLQHL